MMIIPKLLTTIAASILITGCAIGNKYDYRSNGMPLPVHGNGGIGLKVSDQRPYILDGDKEPDFVGLQRAGFGNPFDVTTESGRSMAEDMTESLRKAFEAKGFQVVTMTESGSDHAALVREAQAKGLPHIVLLTIKQWKTDTAMRVNLIYNLQLMVFDENGDIVAQNSIDESRVLGSAPLPSAVSAMARTGFEEEMEKLFDTPEIRGALQSR